MGLTYSSDPVIPSNIYPCFNWIDTKDTPREYEGRIKWIRVGIEVITSIPLEYLCMWARKIKAQIFLDIKLWDIERNVLSLVTKFLEIGVSAISINPKIRFMIDKIAAAKKMLDKHKIKYKAENDGKSGLYLHFKDTDGTILYFVEPKW